MSEQLTPLNGGEAMERWKSCGFVVSFCTMPHSALVRCALSRDEEIGPDHVGDGETPFDALCAVTERALVSLSPEARALWLAF